MSDDEKLKKLLQGIDIPPQPQVMVDLHMEQAMPDPDMRIMTKAIMQDTGLSAAVLKLVNSAYFGLPQKVSNIHQAVTLLGIDNIVHLTNALTVKSELSDDAITSLQGFWDNAMDVAAVCSSIATQLEYPSPEECYALGLFRNAAIPLMMKRFENYTAILEQGYNDPEFNLTNLENKTFKTNHSVVGYYLAKSWGVSKESCYVIANQHRAQEVFKEEHNISKPTLTMLSILKIAEYFCSTYSQIGHASEDYEWAIVGRDVLEFLEITTYELEGMLEICREQGLT
ncbi:HDOD domain-containing protein [Marinomonas agarivorans]|nr:HDOD domain-containing protein [Marinomonas agarivorans]